MNWLRLLRSTEREKVGASVESFNNFLTEILSILYLALQLAQSRNLDKLGKLNPVELKIVTIVGCDSKYNILKVVKGGGDFEEGEVSERGCIWGFTDISKCMNRIENNVKT